MEQQGGYRKPNNPAPVSGPGSLSQRTDGGPTQPAVREVARQAAAAPTAQIATAAPAAATAQMVSEATGSPLAGLVAGTAVGAAPGVRPGRVEAGGGCYPTGSG